MASPFLLLQLLPPLLATVLVAADAQPSYVDPSDGTISFRPSIAIIVGIFSVMFSLTFLLLMYAKFCHDAARSGRVFVRQGRDGDDVLFGAAFASSQGARTSSGIDRTVIESLPFFRFSTLKGHRDGLECAVCLSKFDDAELLRLLPKCKHAFHAGCVDRWLQSHSTCPLCRYRIDPRDAAVFSCSSSSRVLSRDPSGRAVEDATEGANFFELFVEREPEKPLDNQYLHRHKHRIVASGAAFKGRWSDLNSSDLVSLDAEMLRSMITSKRFAANYSSGEDDGIRKIKDELGKKRLLDCKTNAIKNNTTSELEPSINKTDPSRSALLSPRAKRCMSEMTSVSRYPAGGGIEDEKARRLWLPIAQQTLQWLAGRERRPEHGKNTEEEVTIAP